MEDMAADDEIEPDAGGLLAYNALAGEPVIGLDEGRPMIVRTPGSALTLANFMRAQIYGSFAALSLGMRTLTAQDVELDTMYAHGGVFRTADVAQRFLAAAIDTQVAVSATAGEGGAWGMAVLASYLVSGKGRSLETFLADDVFAAVASTTIVPSDADVAGYRTYLERYEAGLAAERAAVAVLR